MQKKGAVDKTAPFCYTYCTGGVSSDSNDERKSGQP